MACCFEELGGYTVTPMLVTPCNPDKCCEGPPMCYPCLPPCAKGKVVYCCEKPPQHKCCRMPDCVDGDCCIETPKKKSGPAQPLTSKHQFSPHPSQEYCCPTCHNPCKQVKTKYVIPCYRYEDGRIEQYVPTRHGRLPMSAYRRNGIQDQIHGYRGAVKYLCTGSKNNVCCVYTAIEPMRRLFPKITQEVLPIKKKKEKKLS